MSAPVHAVIVMGRCSHDRQPFGIRFEEKQRGQRFADWTFAVKETTAKNEGYDRGEITGAFGFDPGFPGCPHCHSKSFFRCACGKVACLNGESMNITCPWCG